MFFVITVNFDLNRNHWILQVFSQDGEQRGEDVHADFTKLHK